jgi:peptidoglycan/LPS O-acetylase OafA/YrhL
MKAKQEITDLTVCRGLLAFWVFIYHVNLHTLFSDHMGPAAGVLIHGYLGVDGFFVLSGLILAFVHPEFKKSLKFSFRFWGKRLARIYPVHLATILILLGLLAAGRAVGMAPADPQRFGALALLENLLLVHGWGFGGQWDWNYPSWSVSSEWAGYLLFPLLWFAFSYWGLLIASEFLVVCAPILGLISHLSPDGLNLTFAPGLLRFFIEFAIGIAAARLVPTAADYLTSVWLLLLAALAILAGAAFGADALTVEGLLVLLAVLMMRAEAGYKPFFGKARILRAFGLLSYSFYMSFAISELLLAAVFRHLGWDPAGEKLLYTGAMCLLTLALAVLLHVAVEKPCRRLGDKWLAPPLAAKK